MPLQSHGFLGGPATLRGFGASFPDGLIRLDLTDTLQPVERWRLALYLDAMF